MTKDNCVTTSSQVPVIDESLVTCSSEEEANTNQIYNDLFQKARFQWLNAQSEQDLKQSEQIFRSILSMSNKTLHRCDEKEDNGDGHQEQLELQSKRQRREETYSSLENDGATSNDAALAQAPLTSRQIQTLAREKLALLLFQSGRTKEGDEILKQLQYTCRLAIDVLNYTHSPSVPPKTTTLLVDPPCRIYQNFLSKEEFEILRCVFADPQHSYWTDHDYKVEPHPSPYFSYVVPLDSFVESSFLKNLIHRILGQLRDWKPTLRQQCTHVEMWAHNRPHATGHQIHFDSDNEGQGAVVRHPLVSTILYLSGRGLGGPSFVTNQRRVSRQLASTKAWLCFPEECQLTAFDGRVLHGVIPGKGAVVSPPENIHNRDGNSTLSQNTHGNRVTLMLAFWKHLQTRNHGSSKVGAARPFPNNNDNNQHEWAKILTQPFHNDQRTPTTITTIQPIPLEHVYETVGGEPWTPRMGMPGYEDIYQGF